MFHLRESGCTEYDRCNSYAIEVDPADLGQIPIVGKWDRPLTSVEQTMYCGFGGVACLSCESCQYWSGSGLSGGDIGKKYKLLSLKKQNENDKK